MRMAASSSPWRCQTKSCACGSTTRFLPNASLPASTTPPQREVAHRRPDHRPQQPQPVRGLAHEPWDDEARRQPRPHAAPGDLVGDDEVIEVDERGDDHQRRENPVGADDRPGGLEAVQDQDEQRRREQLHERIARGDAFVTVRAASTQGQPAHDGQVLVPRDLRLAVRAERTARLVDRQSQRQAVDADVEERTDDPAEDEGRERKEEIVIEQREHKDRARGPMTQGKTG